MQRASHSLFFCLIPISDHGGCFTDVFQQAELLQFFQTGFADRCVAVVILAFVFCYILREGVERPVGCGVGGVEEKRFFRALDGVLLEEGDRVVGDRIGVVKTLRLVFRIVLGRDVLVTPAKGYGIVERAGTDDGSVKFVEASLHRPTIDHLHGFPMARNMPFPGHVGLVAGGAQDFGNRRGVLVDAAAIGGQAEIALHVADARLVGMKTCQQAGASGAAAPGIVELGETDALGGEAVEVRRLDLAAVATQIGKAHVISHDEDDVWFRRGEPDGCEEGEECGKS